MKKLASLVGACVLIASLAGCVIVPERPRPGPYYAAPSYDYYNPRHGYYRY